jgi:DNA-binding XRE family transcriptional regulator
MNFNDSPQRADYFSAKLQAELAAKVGCTKLTIVRIETGKRSPNLRILLEITTGLDIGVALLPKLEPLEL